MNGCQVTGDSICASSKTIKIVSELAVLLSCWAGIVLDFHLLISGGAAPRPPILAALDCLGDEELRQA